MRQRIRHHPGNLAIIRALSPALRAILPEYDASTIHRVYGDSRELHPFEAYAVSGWFSLAVMGMIASWLLSLLPPGLPALLATPPLTLALYILYLQASVVPFAPLARRLASLSKRNPPPPDHIIGLLILSIAALLALCTLLLGWPGRAFAWLLLAPLALNGACALILRLRNQTRPFP